MLFIPSWTWIAKRSGRATKTLVTGMAGQCCGVERWEAALPAPIPYHDQHIAIRVLILDIKLIASLASTVRGCSHITSAGRGGVYGKCWQRGRGSNPNADNCWQGWVWVWKIFNKGILWVQKMWMKRTTTVKVKTQSMQDKTWAKPDTEQLLLRSCSIFSEFKAASEVLWGTSNKGETYFHQWNGTIGK